MTDTPAKPKKKLRYFDMTPEQQKMDGQLAVAHVTLKKWLAMAAKAKREGRADADAPDRWADINNLRAHIARLEKALEA